MAPRMIRIKRSCSCFRSKTWVAKGSRLAQQGWLVSSAGNDGSFTLCTCCRSTHAWQQSSPLWMLTLQK
eukprot:577433-Amphidinium_carterae.1